MVYITLKSNFNSELYDIGVYRNMSELVEYVNTWLDYHNIPGEEGFDDRNDYIDNLVYSVSNYNFVEIFHPDVDEVLNITFSNLKNKFLLVETQIGYNKLPTSIITFKTFKTLIKYVREDWLEDTTNEKTIIDVITELENNYVTDEIYGRILHIIEIDLKEYLIEKNILIHQRLEEEGIDSKDLGLLISKYL